MQLSAPWAGQSAEAMRSTEPGQNANDLRGNQKRSHNKQVSATGAALRP